MKGKKILICLTYYSPYVSGLTNVARDVAVSLYKRGWIVTVLAVRHDSKLPKFEIIDGVRVYRSSVLLRLGKGVLSPSFIGKFVKLSKNIDIINFHAPMLELGLLCLLSRKPKIITYQCDVSLRGGWLAKAVNKTIDLSTRLGIRFSCRVVVSSTDYATHSRLKNILISKSVVIPPTCHFRNLESASARFRESSGLHIGFLGRIVEEKGIEYLVNGFKAWNNKNGRLLIAGDFDNIAGGSVIESVRKAIDGDCRIRILGFISEDNLNDFYKSIDLMALPSINPFEAFGITQVEAMLTGLPVIASDMPGVRQPILKTDFGFLVKPKSESDITQSLLDFENFDINVEDAKNKTFKLYGFDSVINKYEACFLECLKNSH